MVACKKGKCAHLFYVKDDKDLEYLSKIKHRPGAAPDTFNKYCYFCTATPRVKKLGHSATWAGYTTPPWCPEKRI